MWALDNGVEGRLGRTDFAVVDLHCGWYIPDPYQAFSILSALFGNSGRPAELRRLRDIKIDPQATFTVQSCLHLIFRRWQVILGYLSIWEVPSAPPVRGRRGGYQLTMLCLRSVNQVRKRGRRLAYGVRKHASALCYTDIIEVQWLNLISLDCSIDQCTRRRRLQDVEEASTFAAEVAFTWQQHFQNAVNRSRKKHSWHEENYQRVYCSSILPNHFST
jgi:hypothetical protein